MTLHFMSDKELSRLEVLRDLTSGRLTVAAAGELLGLERRQVLRLSKAYKEQGATALISKKRGRTSNRSAPAEVKAQALDLIRQKYADFGPTLAAEKLREVHNIYVGRETLRTWMLEAGVWAKCPDDGQPGLVVSMDVAAGQQVREGEVVCVLEAMKMQNIIRAERDGLVKAVNAKGGDPVAADEVLVEFA